MNTDTGGTEPRGLLCPMCKSDQSKVTDSRGTLVNQIRRRRECLECEHRFTTREVIEHGEGLIESPGYFVNDSEMQRLQKDLFSILRRVRRLRRGN